MPQSFLPSQLLIPTLIVGNTAEKTAASLNQSGIFRAETAHNTATAHALLRHGSFALCIAQASHPAIAKDEAAFIRKNLHRTVFIVLADSKAGMALFKEAKAGAFDVLEYPLNLKNPAHASCLRKAFFAAQFRCCTLQHQGNTSTDAAVLTLTGPAPPQSVEQWAERMKCSGRYLRAIWHEAFGCRPNEAIALVNYYHDAFARFTGAATPSAKSGRTILPARPTRKALRRARIVEAMLRAKSATMNAVSKPEQKQPVLTMGMY